MFQGTGVQEAPQEGGGSSVELLELVQGATFLSHHLCWGRLVGDTVAFTSPTCLKLIPITRELTKMDGISVLSSLSVMSRNSCPRKSNATSQPHNGALGGGGGGLLSAHCWLPKVYCGHGHLGDT